MASEVAIGKRAKISEAQQYMILAVLGAAIFLGVAISLVSHFLKVISFNTKIIMGEEQAIAAYSEVIKTTGVCKSPQGSIYSDAELNSCNPDSIDVSEIPGTLRSNILENLAANNALNSVPKEDNSDCLNPTTGKNFTYAELNEIYDDANSPDELSAASQLIKSCSALRIIPDALPAFKNEEALLASLNRLFIISNWEPESLSPSGTSQATDIGKNLFSISVNLSVEADSNTTMNTLSNIERSIREFNIEQATIEWGGDESLILRAQATAYYMNESVIETITETVKADDSSTDDTTTEEEE
ncbi:hypothetical protein IKE13_01550 [Candidatus Saccharibacteria bacterium]|nr:hypothetical protein [Candidatus Saccharibacteria bacterium]